MNNTTKQDNQVNIPASSDENSDTYNGYTNYETWSLALHINNNRNLTTYVETIANDAYHDACADKYVNEGIMAVEKVAIRNIADRLKQWIEDLKSDFFSTHQPDYIIALLLSDIGSIWRINWSELAFHYWEDYSETRNDFLQ